jgi:hypothetical protein
MSSASKQEPSTFVFQEHTANRTEHLLESTLLRLTKGIPNKELRLIISESDDIEQGLLKDIEILEKALEGKEVDDTVVDELLESLLTPMESSWTAPALLGRLRGELAIPSILSVKGNVPAPPQSRTEHPSALVEVTKHPLYLQEHSSPAPLLVVWKRIFTNKAALVFKKAVRAEEAPGYTDRISFPMDLGLIRKMIVARKIVSLADLHKYVGLISHNCVKYNGRDTDYGIVARDFEAMVDEQIRIAVETQAKATTIPIESQSSLVKTKDNDGNKDAEEGVASDTAEKRIESESTVETKS